MSRGTVLPYIGPLPDLSIDDLLRMRRQDTVMNALTDERTRQDEKWGHADTFAERDNGAWMLILLEEIGELAMAINDKESSERVEEELVQSAAVIVSWLEARAARG